MVIPDYVIMREYSKLANLVMCGDVHRATKYFSPSLTLKATRRLYKGKVLKNVPVEIMFTLGRPNYEERGFIKDCKKAKEPFPVKKPRIKKIRK